MPRRSFNTTGPCDPAKHYMLPPEERLPDLGSFVDEELYFVVRAARQTGKSTAMIAFARRLREAGKAAVYVTLENAGAFPDLERAEPVWLDSVRRHASLQLPEGMRPPPGDADASVGSRFNGLLARWAAVLGDTPLVLLLDEADVITGEAMISLLRQLRDGFATRGVGRFPTSVALIGMRDLRDYLMMAKDGVKPNPGSPFNVKKASLTLRNFTQAEVGRLYAQHTADTGQEFTPEAVERAFYWTQGQPFLVNALAYQCVGYARQLDDPRIEGTVTAQHIDEAKEKLILSRTTHLDSLSYRVKEERVAPILQAILLGEGEIDYEHDDFQYVLDLGLVRRGLDGAEIANPLYREVLVRQLSYNTQMNLKRPWWRWQSTDGGLDIPALMGEFQTWWRGHADVVAEHAPKGYAEAAAQIAFMGFLQRVVNGGGSVAREYAAGMGRIDLLVAFGEHRYVIELKRVGPKDGADRVRAEGVVQLGGYLDTLGLAEGWLVIFDQRKGRTWEQRIWSEDVVEGGRTLHLVEA